MLIVIDIVLGLGIYLLYFVYVGKPLVHGKLQAWVPVGDPSGPAQLHLRRGEGFEGSEPKPDSSGIATKWDCLA